MTRALWVLPGGALLLALAGCSLAPDYQVPASAPSPVYKELADWKPGQPADLPKSAWWSVFNDTGLNDLETRLDADNQTLKQAVFRYDEARAVARQAASSYYPQITGNAGATHTEHSRRVASPIRPRNANDLIIDPTISYEIDVWGRVRNTVAQQRALAQASAADLGAVALSLQAELAGDYFTLRGYDSQQSVFDQTVDAYARALKLEISLHDGGAAAEVDVAQAEAQLNTAKTQASDNRLKRATMEHAIAILLGETPATFSLAPLPLGATPPMIQPGLPSSLLERRPDVAEAERRVAAANAAIGVARAAYYPVFSLTGALGFESASPAQLFSGPAGLWGAGINAIGPIFDAGKTDALNEQVRAQYNETVAAYRETVLEAYRDVEDSLAGLHQLGDEAQSEAAAVRATAAALRQAQLRYSGGLTTYLEVVSAQNAALQADLTAVDIKTRQLNTTVSLVKAIGGDWNGATGMALDDAAAR